VNDCLCTCALHLSEIKRINTAAAFYVHVRRYHIGSQGVVCNEEHGTGLAGRRLRRDELTRVYARRVCMVCSRYGSSAPAVLLQVPSPTPQARHHVYANFCPGPNFKPQEHSEIWNPRGTFAVLIVEFLSEPER
jgi:hypothetical protein